MVKKEPHHHYSSRGQRPFCQGYGKGIPALVPGWNSEEEPQSARFKPHNVPDAPWT